MGHKAVIKSRAAFFVVGPILDIPVDPRRASAVVANEISAVVETVSRGSNAASSERAKFVLSERMGVIMAHLLSLGSRPHPVWGKDS